MRILLVEDEPELGAGIRLALKPEGYTVDWLQDGLQALNALRTEEFDLVILDLGLPGLEGLSLLRQLRNQGNDVPVLILTARDAVQDRIQGLDSGADDYLTKPFEISELQARIRALLRRRNGRAQLQIECRGITLDPSAQQVWYQGQPVTLTRREYSLLHELISQPGHVFTRDTLQQRLYGWDEDVESNAMEVHIHHLRKKLFPQLIHTVRGIGYVIDKEDKL